MLIKIKKIDNEICAKLLTICLGSLDIQENAVKNWCIEHKSSLMINYEAIQYSLLTVWNAINLNNKQKQKVISVLENYLNNYRVYREHHKGLERKYLERFKYKYKQCHNTSLQFKDKNKFKTINDYHLIAIITLYCLYRILKANSKFSTCRKLKNKS